MTHLEDKSILDRLNDVEATIAQVARDAGESPSLAVRLSLQSLQSRRDMMREELVEYRNNHSLWRLLH